MTPDVEPTTVHHVSVRQCADQAGFNQPKRMLETDQSSLVNQAISAAYLVWEQTCYCSAQCPHVQFDEDQICQRTA